MLKYLIPSGAGILLILIMVTVQKTNEVKNKPLITPQQTEIKIYKEFGELKGKVVPKKTRHQKLDDLLYRQSLETKEVTFGDGRKTKFYRNTPYDQERMQRDIQRQVAEQLRERIE